MNMSRAWVTAAAGWGLCCALSANPLPVDEPPEWTDEPPRLSRWIEEGYEAQRRTDLLTAAARYCAAAAREAAPRPPAADVRPLPFTAGSNPAG